MKKGKYVLIVVCILLLVIISIMIFKPNDKKKYEDKSIFLSSIKEIYKTAKSQYTDDIKYFGKINNVSCESDINTNLDYDNLSYYYSFDDNGNINKIFAYNDKYIFELEKDNITIDDLGSTLYSDVKDNPYIKDYDNNFKLSCEGKING